MIDEPDDAIATGAVAALLSDLRPEVDPQPHVPGRARRHARGDRPRRDRPAAPVRRLDRPFEPGPVRGGPPAVLRILTPRMDRLIAVSRSIVEKLEHEGRDTAPISLIHNGVDLERYDHQDPCCTLREEYGLPGRGPDRRRRRPARAGEGPPDAPRGVAGRRGRRPGRDPARRRRGQSARGARGAGRRARHRRIGSSSPAGATTSRR